MASGPGSRMSPRYSYLSFRGGGAKGLAYIGALRALEETGITKKPVLMGVAGASAGSITAFLVALGYSYLEVAAFFEKPALDLLLPDLKINGGLVIDPEPRVERNLQGSRQARTALPLLDLYMRHDLFDVLFFSALEGRN